MVKTTGTLKGPLPFIVEAATVILYVVYSLSPVSVVFMIGALTTLERELLRGNAL